MSEKIQPAELIQLQSSQQKPLVIDVRSAEEYLAEHVSGAIHIPLEELEDRLDSLPKQTVVPYCNMFHPGASRGEKARDLLQLHGLDARVLDGGLSGWKDAGLPLKEDL